MVYERQKLVSDDASSTFCRNLNNGYQIKFTGKVGKGKSKCSAVRESKHILVISLTFSLTLSCGLSVPTIRLAIVWAIWIRLVSMFEGSETPFIQLDVSMITTTSLAKGCAVARYQGLNSRDKKNYSIPFIYKKIMIKYVNRYISKLLLRNLKTSHEDYQSDCDNMEA